MAKLIVCNADNVEITGIPSEIKILPLGHVKSQKGDFEVDDASFEMIYNNFKQRKLDIVIDYEHQTLDDVQAPASGWIKDLYKGEDAIIAKVEWTQKAQEYLQNKEYRYLSPVVYARKNDKRAFILHSCALTNKPAIDGMFPIINSVDIEDDEINGGKEMELEKLIELLGLPEGTTVEEVLQELQKMSDAKKETEQKKETDPKKEEKAKEDPKDSSELVANKTICSLLGITNEAKTEDVAAAIMALKTPSDMVPVSEFLALKQRIDRQDANDLVLMAMKAGKITKTQKEWADEYALKDPVGFKRFVEKAPQTVPMDKINFDTREIKTGMDDTELMVCKMLGISKEDVAKYGGKVEA